MISELQTPTARPGTSWHSAARLGTPGTRHRARPGTTWTRGTARISAAQSCARGEVGIAQPQRQPRPHLVFPARTPSRTLSGGDALRWCNVHACLISAPARRCFVLRPARRGPRAAHRGRRQSGLCTALDLATWRAGQAASGKPPAPQQWDALGGCGVIEIIAWKCSRTYAIFRRDCSLPFRAPGSEYRAIHSSCQRPAARHVPRQTDIGRELRYRKEDAMCSMLKTGTPPHHGRKEDRISGVARAELRSWLHPQPPSGGATT